MTPTTLEWFGTATFRVRHAGLDLFFDSFFYLDRLPGLDPVGLSTSEVGKADFVFVSHAHFDHLYGADAIALRTGATVVASPESAHCLRRQRRARGTAPCRDRRRDGAVRSRHDGARVLPALHSCLFAHSDPRQRYLLQTAGGSVLVSGSAGYWRGIFDGLGAGRVASCHHDPLFPGFPGVDIEAAAGQAAASDVML